MDIPKPSLSLVATSTNPDGLLPPVPRKRTKESYYSGQTDSFFKSVQWQVPPKSHSLSSTTLTNPQVRRRHNPLHLLVLQPNQHFRPPLRPPLFFFSRRRLPKSSHPHTPRHAPPSRTLRSHRSLPLLRPRASLNTMSPNSQYRPSNSFTPCFSSTTFIRRRLRLLE